MRSHARPNETENLAQTPHVVFDRIETMPPIIRAKSLQKLGGGELKVAGASGALRHFFSPTCAPPVD